MSTIKEIVKEKYGQAAIRAALNTQRSNDRSYLVEVIDAAGTACARVEKIIYIRRREQKSTTD